CALAWVAKNNSEEFDSRTNPFEEKGNDRNPTDKYKDNLCDIRDGPFSDPLRSYHNVQTHHPYGSSKGHPSSKGFMGPLESFTHNVNPSSKLSVHRRWVRLKVLRTSIRCYASKESYKCKARK
ncbi:hypothetical protein CR513_19174, partial [Mucuna pruriens]